MGEIEYKSISYQIVNDGKKSINSVHVKMIVYEYADFIMMQKYWFTQILFPFQFMDNILGINKMLLAQIEMFESRAIPGKQGCIEVEMTLGIRGTSVNISATGPFNKPVQAGPN